VRREATAIHEANLLKIPVIALVDTNCDPRDVDYVIPSNDDAIRAIKLLVGKMADAALEGKAMRKDLPEEKLVSEMRTVIPGVEERELSDEELLGEATLAKISFKARALDLDIEDEEVIVEEIGVEEVATDVWEDITATEEEVEVDEADEVDEVAEEEVEEATEEEEQE